MAVYGISNDDIPYWLALWRTPGIGSKGFRRLLLAFPCLKEAFQASPVELKSLGLKEQQISHLHSFYQQRNKELAQGVHLDQTWLEQDSCHLVSFNDPLYPVLLQEIDNAPPLLFVRGDLALLNWPQIAIVGSRHPSRKGEINAREFARHFVQQGFAVTSGLAMGVDAAAHRGAIAGDGPTIGVTAHGLDSIYPKQNRPLAGEMLNQGAWVSEFPIGVLPRPSYFPRRNRIISGLSLGVLVVEAALKSGSLITARQAIAQNREVFAIPGSIHNPLAKGCHEMIRQGAKLVEQAEDVTAELKPLLGYQQQQLNLAVSEESDTRVSPALPAYDKKSHEFQVLNVLDYDPMLVDEIVIRTGIHVSDVNSALVMLEIDGAISSYQGGYALAHTPA
ncbi:MAG: DNA-protecting protein DprA [Gammaproteobacteria bacterium]|nr:MAG: DNA-protecting protein DprA [Gammaproteobacteria bacterium]